MGEVAEIEVFWIENITQMHTFGQHGIDRHQEGVLCTGVHVEDESIAVVVDHVHHGVVEDGLIAVHDFVGLLLPLIFICDV